MNANLTSTFGSRSTALIVGRAAFLAALIQFTTITHAPAQTGWGNALSFDGFNDVVTASGITLSNSALTIELWAQRTTFNAWNPLVCQGWGSFSNGLCFGFAGNGMAFEYYGGGLWTPQSFPDTNWHHWAATHDRATGQRCIYRDGEVVATDTNWGTYTGTGDLWIGKMPWSAPDYFGGRIDEVRIWKAARSAPEIRQHFRHRITGWESNLLAYWNFDEGAGVTAHDSTTNGHDALVTGPQWTTSTVPFWGKALTLDGADDYVTVTNFGNVMPTNEVTVEFWLRIITNKYEWPVIFGLNPDQIANRFLVHVPCRYFYEVYWHFGDINAGGACLSNWRPVPLGEWRHFAFVASQSGNFMKVFVNGTEHRAVLNFNDLAPGNYSLELGRLVVGDLDEFRVWNTARTAAEIQADMFHPLTGTEPNLVAYWNFDEGTGTVARDMTSNGHNGVLLNDIAWISSSIPTAAVFGPCVPAGPGQLRLRATGSPDVTYTLQTSSNLMDWINYTNLTANPDGLIQRDENPTNSATTGFYRLRWP